MQGHGKADVVRVFPDQRLYAERFRELRFVILEMQRDPGTARFPLELLDREFAFTIGLPAHTLVSAGATRLDRNPVGNDK